MEGERRKKIEDRLGRLLTNLVLVSCTVFPFNVAVTDKRLGFGTPSGDTKAGPIGADPSKP